MTFTPGMPPPPVYQAGGFPPGGPEPIQVGIGPAAPQSRLTVLFRPILAIPHAIVLYGLNLAAG